MKQLLVGLFVLGCGVGLLAIPSPLPGQVGRIDFRAYWSASYLLTHRQNPYAPEAMVRIEQGETGWQEDYAMMVWNPPWLAMMLLPYAMVPFARATWWWALTNIVIVFACAILLWRLSVVDAPSRRLIGLALFVAFIYSPISTALIAGQVNLLVLAGLVGFLCLADRPSDWAAGACLAFATIKPQLVYLTVPVILFECVRMRRWRVVLGFAGMLGGLSLVALVLRPTLIAEYVATFSAGNLLGYAAPTVGSWVGALFGANWATGLCILMALLTFGGWWRLPGRFNLRVWIDITLLLSVITAPFAWSYDFVVLLFPLFSIIGWLIAKGKSFFTFGLAIGLIIFNSLIFYQRFYSQGEEYFVWVPLLIAGVYLFGNLGQKKIIYA